MKHLSPVRKYEIANKYRFTDEVMSVVECFYDYISCTMTNFINGVCRDSEPQSIQMEYPVPNIIMKFEYDTNVQITLLVKASDTTTDAIVTMFKDILYHRLFLSNYKSTEDIRIEYISYSDITTREQLNIYTIAEEQIMPIITDKSYER